MWTNNHDFKNTMIAYDKYIFFIKVFLLYKKDTYAYINKAIAETVWRI